ncbi:MAG: hypothetical protein PHH17_02975 [Candidatus Pacebacteria bacterium]|nr:hypothetical protein [Candidatus Paceibacterota bacterium]MDD3072626.1 hypothetical protein [Candidatus Paceibacterota bacterium]MDD3729329.1 hypothetical protein [Candidatus Paceibacterota bacterium]MDD4897495.1 hypothetical protein [Candidatus Paceibacterota bacterium]MDD5446137.1 hypothetical protein [Candidatus Paceibacterota bacterium]
MKRKINLLAKLLIVAFVAFLFVFLFFGIFGEEGVKMIRSIFQGGEGGVFAEGYGGYGYEDDPDPEDPEEEPGPDPEEEPDMPEPNGFYPDSDRKLIVEFQSYCYSMGEGEILFSWAGLDPQKEYIFQIWEDDTLIINKENLNSTSTLVYVKEDPIYGYGIGGEIGFGKNYKPRVQNYGDGEDWIDYDESIDSQCALVGGTNMPLSFGDKGDCNPDGFNLDTNNLTFTTASHPFPYVRYSQSPEKLDIETEITFTFTGWCYDVNCSTYSWTFDNADPSSVNGSVATTTFIEEKRTSIGLLVEDEDQYGCLYSREPRVGLILSPTWREIPPFF